MAIGVYIEMKVGGYHDGRGEGLCGDVGELMLMMVVVEVVMMVMVMQSLDL